MSGLDPDSPSLPRSPVITLWRGPRWHYHQDPDSHGPVHRLGLFPLRQKCQMVKLGVGYGVWPVGARPGGVLLTMALSHVRGMGNSQGLGYCPGIDMVSGCTEVQGLWGFRPSKEAAEDPIYEATAPTSEGKLAAEPSSSK